MDPVPIIPGFYIRRSIPDEVYHLETITYNGRTTYHWRWWCVGATSTPLEFPIEEMRRLVSIGDLVMMVPEN